MVTKAKKLYAFLSHGQSDCHHTLFALNLPIPASSEVPDALDTPCTITTTIVTTRRTDSPNVISNLSRRVEKAQPIPIEVGPLLRFSCYHWPQGMTCTRLGTKLYFSGGRVGTTGHSLVPIDYPRDFYVLNLCSSDVNQPPPWSFTDHPEKVLTQMPRMRSGKIDPISFAADDKIFVLSGRKMCPHTGKDLIQFEIFDVKLKQWETGETPPFTNVRYMGPYVICDRQVIVAEAGGFQVYSYNLDGELGKKWSVFDTSCWSKLYKDVPFYFEEGSQWAGNNTIFSWVTGHRPFIPHLIRLKKHKDKKDLVVEECDVIKHRIPALEVSGALTRINPKHLCFVQAGELPRDKGTAISLTLIEVSEEGDSAKYLNSSHYVTSRLGYVRVVVP